LRIFRFYHGLGRKNYHIQSGGERCGKGRIEKTTETVSNNRSLVKSFGGNYGNPGIRKILFGCVNGKTEQVLRGSVFFDVKELKTIQAKLFRQHFKQ